MPVHPSLTAVSRDEVNALQSLSLSSGYQRVYEKKHAWQAKLPLGRGSLGTYPTAYQAAVAVALWMRSVFGENWVSVHREWHKPGVEAVPVQREGGTEWVARVYEDGVLRVLFPDGGGLGYPTRAEALRVAERYARDTFGLFAPVVVRRGGPCGFLRG